MLRAIRLFWAVALLSMAFGAAAQRVEGERARAQGPYAAEVKVNGQGAPERNNAFVRALVAAESERLVPVAMAEALSRRVQAESVATS